MYARVCFSSVFVIMFMRFYNARVYTNCCSLYLILFHFRLVTFHAFSFLFCFVLLLFLFSGVCVVAVFVLCIFFIHSIHVAFRFYHFCALHSTVHTHNHININTNAQTYIYIYTQILWSCMGVIPVFSITVIAARA